nr:MAG TPA: tail spike protein [Bacteriophage sp.]
MNIDPIHKAPYTNFHDLNLDWIMEVLNEFNTKLTNFVSLATIKYANPIQWDITSQYEANTVVVDSNGNAYLSVQPVPSGVSLDRTEFWTKIGNFDELWADVKKAITPNDEGHSPTATADRAVNDLVWVNGALVRVTKTMSAGDAYVPGSNCVSSSTNEVLNYLITAFNEGLSAEKAAREDADTQLQTDIDNETQARKDADTQLQTAIGNETQARIEADKKLQKQIEDKSSGAFANVKDYGALGNGLADDTEAIKRAMASGLPLLFPDGTYNITQDVTLTGSYFAYNAMLIATTCTVTITAPIAGANCHFRKANNGTIKMTDSVVLVDWFNYEGDLGSAISNYLSDYEGTVKFGRPATYEGLGTDTTYIVSNNIYLQPHTTYDLQGCVIKLTTANSKFIFNGSNTAHVERTIFRNGVIIGTTDAVDAAFTSEYSERFFIEDMFIIGCRKVLECAHTVNMQVRNIIHDIALETSKPITSYHLVENSTGATGISGNASFRAENCISSLGSATGDRWMFLADSSNDIRDIYISNCECSNSNGIWINATSTPSTVWDILIDGFIADQCPNTGIYLTNCLQGAVHIINSYSNATAYGIRLVKSTAVINTCQFLATAPMNGIYIEGGCKAVSISHCTFIDVSRPIQISDGIGTLVDDITVVRNTLHGENAPAVFVGSEWCFITRLSGWDISPAYTAGVQFGAGNCTFGFINGFDPTKYSKLGAPTNIQQISTTAI